MNKATHIPVMLKEVVAALRPKDGALYIDGTFGAGGYSEALLRAADCHVIAIDRDPEAISMGQEICQRHHGRLRLVEGRFGQMKELLAAQKIDRVDGVTLDVGVSSMQLDQADRGFSFRADGPLDMRMEMIGRSAADLVAELAEQDLADLIYQYGEEKRSRAIARAIVAERHIAPITTTRKLAHIVHRVLGSAKDGRIDPATRTFQALRIAVNDELGELGHALDASVELMKPGTRLAIVTFHSLEDRMVKNFMREKAGKLGGQSRYIPANDHAPASLKIIGAKGIVASAEEISQNPRARSARLRVAERLALPGAA